jgi:uncharacterized protein YbjT (DUF2867 family)
MTCNKVIVFGASGNVASATAAAARQEGATVYLASRNPGTTGSDDFKTVYADLSKPETVRDAIRSSGATRAFFYLLMTANDAMRGVIEAMNEAGIEFVVFLSSFNVHGDKTKADPSNFIAMKHAKVEMVLEEVLGLDRYAAVRPGYFATNALRWRPMVAAGEVKIPFADAIFDWIDERDIGAVAGKLLAGNSQALSAVPSDGGLPICGAELISQRQAAETVAQTLGKDLKITSLTGEEGAQFYVDEAGIPEPMAKQLIKLLRERDEQGPTGQYGESKFSNGQINIRRVTGKDPTGFAQWAEHHKAHW